MIGKSASLKKINDEIYYASDDIVKISSSDIESLIFQALKNTRKRARICTHRDITDAVHEMLIVHFKGNYIRPHKHINKSESWHIVKGRADVVLFDESGNVSEVIPVGDSLSSDRFYFRVNNADYHTMLIKSEHFVFHEVTSGPFNKNDTIFAPWSPEENEFQRTDEYMQELSKIISDFVNHGPSKLQAG